MRDNSKFRWFRHVEGRNNDETVTKIGKIRIKEKSLGKGRPKIEWMEVLWEDIKACEVYEDIVRNRKE